jgi:hypothetical protein
MFIALLLPSTSLLFSRLVYFCMIIVRVFLVKNYCNFEIWEICSPSVIQFWFRIMDDFDFVALERAFVPSSCYPSPFSCVARTPSNPSINGVEIFRFPRWSTGSRFVLTQSICPLQKFLCGPCTEPFEVILMFLRIKNLDLAYNENHKSIYDAILGLAYLNHVSSNKLGSPLHLLPALYLRLFHTFETHKFLRLLKCITFSFLFFSYFFIKEDGPPKYLYHYISSFY